MSPARTSAVWAVVPVKAFVRGKSRLGSVLSDPARTEFARALFEHVASVLLRAPSVRGVVVVTHDQEVSASAEAHGFVVVQDPPGCTLAVAIDAGRAAASRLGASAVLVCMADLPRLSVDDVEAVIEALSMHQVVLVPDQVDAGTNLLATAPALALASCFGQADSFERHLARAREQGFSPLVLRLPGVCFDVDGPEDLEQVTARRE